MVIGGFRAVVVVFSQALEIEVWPWDCRPFAEKAWKIG
jgi:hypothetical protein